MHPDGYVELRDRAKDIIISGGENISTVEVEQALLSHDAVLEAAVVGMPDDHWGERPKAFVVIKPGHDLDEDAVIEHVRGQIARFKAPDAVEFVDELPKTSTGKIQKNELREHEWAAPRGPHPGLRRLRRPPAPSLTPRPATESSVPPPPAVLAATTCWCRAPVSETDG